MRVIKISHYDLLFDTGVVTPPYNKISFDHLDELAKLQGLDSYIDFMVKDKTHTFYTFDLDKTSKEDQLISALAGGIYAIFI